MSRTTRSARLCYLQPALLRPLDGFGALLDRCAGIGADTVVLPHPFVEDAAWQQARLADPDRLAPVFGWNGSALEGLARLVALARERDLQLMIDVRLDQVAGDAGFVAAQPRWFRPCRTGDGALPDPRHPQAPARVAMSRFDSDPAGMAGWWSDWLVRWCESGLAGFRCLWPQHVPAAVWKTLIAGTRERCDVRFLAWTPGLPPQQVRALAGSGFDAAFHSLAWWDFRSAWYLEEDAALRGFAATIAAVDAPLDGRGTHRGTPASGDDEDRRRARLRAIEFGVATSDGIMLALDDGDPMAGDTVDPVLDPPPPRRRKGLRPLWSDPAGPASALLLEPADTAATPRLLLVNGDTRHLAGIMLGEALQTAAEFAAFTPRAATPGPELAAGIPVLLEPAEVRVYDAHRADPIIAPTAAPVSGGTSAARIAIERVSPAVDAGRFPVKRSVGERVRVQADIFCDGHDLLAAAVLWRPLGEREWQSTPMRQLGNDRWGGEFTLQWLGRHEFTIEAWRDAFATARSDLEKKRAAGKLTTLDIDEVCQLVAAEKDGDAALRSLAGDLAASSDDDERAALLVSPDAAEAMARADHRPFLTRCDTVFTVDAERRGAAFASWYELFPRSQAAPAPDGSQRHGTFDDVIARLPAIRDMGFDVLYMPPIHPIGQSNRKGRNNSVTAQPGEPGSPYAIGSADGGHDAIHPELGTLGDFRRLVSAAAGHGMEVALDFAIQCSPDHPWLREHPDWFAWRADGSIRYAENPPKKYEDIVNVDFYAGGGAGRGSVPDLWIALRDVVAFWVDEGVRLFRVDNPHTKPFPFWEWMIGDIRARHPDVVFLAEAFTRPKVMYRLAKLGFSQSYTYFTWRNHKQELTDYLTELAQGEPREFFRPHFFVNTPDINPVFLQTSGRPGHLVRAVLAATLSGLWGMYSGFELCEATPIPGKEEYLDSEKYQLRAWDWQRPGNIIDEITRLNLLRRLHPALQTHLGVRFYNAFNDHILYYGKRRSDRDDMILVAVNLDPHQAQEAHFEAPLWEWGLPDHGSLEVEDLWRGTRSRWTGKVQHLRLDPQDLPFAIWRVGPTREVVG